MSHLPTVDLKVAARDNEVVVFVFWRLEQFEDVPGCESIDSVLRVLRLPVELPAHCVGLAWGVIMVMMVTLIPMMMMVVMVMMVMME